MIPLPEMVEIPAGPVLLGAPECPESFSLKHRWRGPREVFVPAFRVGRFQVTRREHEVFLEATRREAPADWEDPLLKDLRLPVCGVSWEDAQAYCAWLAEVSGRSFRLPTADEWEKAARGRLVGKRYPWGDEDPVGRCSFGKSSDSAPSPVGSFPPNGYGIYDAAGNVWEWLNDLYIGVAADAPVNVPTGRPPELNRVLAGGSFMTPGTDPLWVAYRHEDPPDLRHRCLGFRLAL